MSGTYLLNFGPRTAHAARDLAAAVYPDLKLPALPARPWTGHDDGSASH
jgi:iron complex transport system substrate-binding protein